MFRQLHAWLLYPLAERWLGRDIRSKAAGLRTDMAAAFAARRARRQARLADMLAAAGRDVPYYRDLFKRLRFNPESVRRSVDHLQEIPFLTKEILREEGTRLCSERFPLQTLHVRKTGGSTGPGATIYYSPEALDWTSAVNAVAQEWAGKRRTSSELHFASRFPERFPWRDRLKERVKGLTLNRHNLFSADFEPDSLDGFWRSLRRVTPYLVQGHPSTLYALAVHLREAGRDARGVFTIFESTGEALDAKKRETIASVFGCRVINRFGNAEFGVVAYERLDEPNHRLQVFDGVVWPEALEHESGSTELVLTGLLNDAMPLVRYRTGDLANLIATEQGFYLHHVAGRVHDLVRIGDRHYPTHYVQDLLDRIGGIDEFQIEERDGRPLLLRLVMHDTFRQAAAAERIRQWWDGAVEVEFTEFGGLTRSGWRGKFRYVVQSAAA
jgi:phenylacetate-CoA ligase